MRRHPYADPGEVSEQLEVGDRVTFQKAPGCRIFEAVILQVRDDGSVDVRDPRNGALRTLRPELVRRTRKARQ